MSIPVMHVAEPSARPAARTAVFIDKNGTLLEDAADDSSPDALHFRPGAFEAISLLAQRGHAVVVMTSAPGLGLGLLQRGVLSAVEHTIETRIAQAAGVRLAGFYTCPHKPGERGEPACLCRVPAPGLLRQAAASLRLDLKRCWVIGDMLNDVEAGRRVGARTVLVEGGMEREWRMSPLRTPHHRAAGLLEAAQFVVNAAPTAADLALEIAMPDAGASSIERDEVRAGPLRPYEPHPTREWL